MKLIQIKDYVYDEDRKIVTIWFEDITFKQVQDIINQYQKQPKEEKQKEDSMMSAIWPEDEENLSSKEDR